MMARMRPTYFADCSSEIDVGSVARIQKLPSSSLGMNSRPSGRGQREDAEDDAPTANDHGERACARRTKSNSGT